jgi:hypothetical protein
MVGSGSGSGSGSSTSKSVASASTNKNAPGSLKAKSEVLQSLAGFLQEGLSGEGGDKDPYWFLRNSLGTAHARKSFNTTRVHLSSRQGLSGKRKGAPGTTFGRSSRRKVDTSDVSGEEDNDEDAQEGNSHTDDMQSDYSSDPETTAGDEPFVLDASPVVSFSRASRHHQCLDNVPIHPSAIRSTVAQTIFGPTQDLGLDANDSTSIHIRIFHQQGGVAASGTGTSIGSGGPRIGEGQILGGVQGRLSQIKPLISTLHPLLLSVWLDTAPTVFSSTTTVHAGHALNITHLVLRIWGILWRAALARPKKKNVDSDEEQEHEREEAKWLEEYLQGLLRHVLIYFPFGKDTVGMVDSKVTLQAIQWILCDEIKEMN